MQSNCQGGGDRGPDKVRTCVDCPDDDMHMRLVKVNSVYQVECKAAPKANGHCPSVDAILYPITMQILHAGLQETVRGF